MFACICVYESERFLNFSRHLRGHDVLEPGANIHWIVCRALDGYHVALPFHSQMDIYVCQLTINLPFLRVPFDSPYLLGCL